MLITIWESPNSLHAAEVKCTWSWDPHNGFTPAQNTEGRETPGIRIACPIQISAYGESLDWVRKHFSGIRMDKTHSMVNWVGDDALFILNALVQRDYDGRARTASPATPLVPA